MLKRYDLTPARLVFVLLMGAFLGIFLLYPLAHVLMGAVFVKDPATGERGFTLTFFRLLATDPTQWRVVFNSLKIAFLSTVMTTLVALPIAYATTRYDFRGKGLLHGLILVPMVLPPFVGAVGMQQLFARSELGAVNSLLLRLGIISGPVDWFGGGLAGVVVMEVLHLYPIMYLNVAAALANVDPAMEEAAKNMGAGGFKLFRKITFPLMLPGYFAGAIIVFIWAFTDLGTPLIFNYRNVISVQIFDSLDSVHENPMGYAMVALMLIMSAGFFYVSKLILGRRRYDMMARGHTTGATRRASRPMALLIHTALIGLTLAALLPHISVVLTAVADKWSGTVLPDVYTSAHFAEVFNDSMTAVAIKNSLFLSSLSTLADVAVGIALAYLLIRTRIPGRGILDALAMLPLAVPGLIIAFGYVAAFSGTFLNPRVNPVPLLIIAYAVRRLPYMLRAAYAGFQQTHVSLEEAAQNVGATPARALRRITFPLILANLAGGAILCFAFAMLEVSDSLILAAEERFYPITKAIYALFTRPTSDGVNIACAMGVLGMVLLAVSLFLAGRFLGRRMGTIFRA